MVPTSRLEYPAWSHHESVLRCPEPAWCLFSAPEQRVQGSALATERFLPGGGRISRFGGPACTRSIPARLGTSQLLQLHPIKY